jgi:hypothetical protein
MRKRRIAFSVVGCIMVCSLLFFGTIQLHSEENASGEVNTQDPASEETRDVSKKALSEEEAQQLLERFIFVSIPDIFEDLKRAPVKFYHDKHTKALLPEGCDTCHPQDEKNKFIFTYPKVRDEKDKDALMNSFHNDCIGCHTERVDAGKKAGPVTCGECHVMGEDYHTHEYLPILPEYYEVLRDTYHKDCIACHQEPAKSAEEAGGLDWKSFYVKECARVEETWPKVAFDYYLHDTHDKALEEKCELCHFLSPEREGKLKAEGKEPSCKDWLKELDKENSLTEEDTAHPRCINCHLERKEETKDAGPFYCRECHTGVERTIEEMAEVKRQECEQEEKILIELEEGARAQGVPFNHKSHQENTRSCQDCHHETLRACGECHTVEGCEEGEGITLAEAYHEVSSPWSCIGCHEAEKKKPDCAGCHHLMEGGLVESACTTCHTGSLKDLDAAHTLPAPEELIPDETKEEMEITLLENEYGPSKLKHLTMVKKLTDSSNNSKLASYFHTDEMTICQGCHHFGPTEKKGSVPQCSTCHTARKEPEKKIPTLLGAYHQQCLGCHGQMGGTEEEMPKSCTGCHEEKEKK